MPSFHSRRAHRAARLLAVVAGVSLPGSLAAQAVVTANLYANSAFVWRGVTFAGRPVVQADLGLALPVVGGTVSGGVWLNGEPADYTSGRAITMVATGRGGPALTAIAPWLDYTRPMGRVTSTFGVTTYAYPAITGFAPAFNTTELYARLALAAPLSPRVSVNHDLRKVRGAYVEGALAQAMPLGRRMATRGIGVTLGATAGWSAGQGPNGTQTAYFGHEGLAFVDATASAALPIGHGLSVAPTLHLSFGRDSLARVQDLTGHSRTFKPWLGVAASWSHALGRPARP